MFCEEVLLGLVNIYAVPASAMNGKYTYPWNVPFRQELASISPAETGFSTAKSLKDYVKANALLLTNQLDYADSNDDFIYCQDNMSLQSKKILTVAGISWTNTVKCTVIHEDSSYDKKLASMITEPHDLFFEDISGKWMLVRSVETAYQCTVTKKMSESGFTSDVQFTVINVHGAQEVV